MTLDRGLKLLRDFKDAAGNKLLHFTGKFHFSDAPCLHGLPQLIQFPFQSLALQGRLDLRRKNLELLIQL